MPRKQTNITEEEIMYTRIKTTNRHSLSRLMAAALLVASCAATAAAQTKPASQSGTTPSAAKAPTAQYDLGLMVKHLSQLDAQVAELKKRNEALEAVVKKMQVQIGSLDLQKTTSGNLKTGGVDKVTAELQRLDNALRNHTHSMPSVGIMALSAIPGMQELANKAGIGHVIQQWQSMKMLWTTGSGGNLERTGPARLPQQ
jgi:hypothetical protein